SHQWLRGSDARAAIVKDDRQPRCVEGFAVEACWQGLRRRLAAAGGRAGSPDEPTADGASGHGGTCLIVGAYRRGLSGGIGRVLGAVDPAKRYRQLFARLGGCPCSKLRTERPGAPHIGQSRPFRGGCLGSGSSAASATAEEGWKLTSGVGGREEPGAPPIRCSDT